MSDAPPIQPTRSATSPARAATFRSRGRTATTSAPRAPVGPLATDSTELHARWDHARRVIQEVLSREQNPDPRIWERGVYQLWLWLVIERLVVRRDEIDVGELSVISRMLSDHRKLTLDEARTRPAAPDDDDARAAGRLPERFGEIVRQIYGTDLTEHAPASNDAGPSETEH